MNAVRGNYKTNQKYEYDNLYQLVKVEGSTTYDPYRSSVPEFVSDYSQTFAFDAAGLGNMVSKVSSETVTPKKSVGDDLNYSFKYVYDEKFAHRLVSAGDRHYKYDSNGNVICEQDGVFDGAEPETYHKITQEDEDVYSTDYAWGYYRDSSKKGMRESKRYRRVYTWNERNLLVSSVDSTYSTAYVYGQDGQRSNKYTQNSETLYFNKMWTLHTDSGNNIYGGQSSKHIYLGESRIVTKLNSGTSPTYQEEYYKQYFYHSDHLGSASLVSDYKGDEYQRIEYTPYGESWVEKTQNVGLEYLPYKFTGKEMDEETGLYYYGARYMDPKYSRWLSTDPALGEYIPKAPINEDAKKYNQNLPGMGGVFNHINSNLYHYAGNNPIKYIDPNGREDDYFTSTTYETYEIAITEVQNYIKENYNGNEFAGLIEINNEGKYFFKIKEGERQSTTWGYALMESADELQNVKYVFHSHPSLRQELKDSIIQNYPTSTDIQITLEFGNMTTNNGDIASGFIYVGSFSYTDGDDRYICRIKQSAAISSNDIYNSTIYPDIPSLVFSSDFDEYCIIINGQIINPARN